MNELFRIKLTIHGKPELPNKSHGHWATLQRQRERWHSVVARSVLFRPEKPLKKCRLICVRHSSRKCDYDGLVYSFKPLVDALVKQGIIVDDDLFTIVERSYQWCKTPEKQAFVTIEVEEII